MSMKISGLPSMGMNFPCFYRGQLRCLLALSMKSNVQNIILWSQGDLLQAFQQSFL